MFISIEGIEGSGKSTAMAGLVNRLESLGFSLLCTREPGGSRLGAPLRAILLDPANTEILPYTELFLYLADRTQHVGSVIRPALERGLAVITDRYADSTVVYQGYGRGLDPALLRQLNDIAVGGLWPDITFLLDLPAETGLRRALSRNSSEGSHQREGRFEAEHLDFHIRIREGYLAWAALNHPRFRVIDASQAQEDVLRQIHCHLDAFCAAYSSPRSPAIADPKHSCCIP